MFRTKLAHSNSNTTCQNLMIDDKTAQEVVSYYPFNRLRSRCLVRKGCFHGTCTVWYENGNKKLEEPYFCGRLHGVVRTWHSNGRLESLYPYRGGFGHGVARTWDENGQLMLVQLAFSRRQADPNLLTHLEELILKCELAAKDIVGIKNAELRRLLMEDMGYEKFTEQLNPEVLDDDGYRELLRVVFHPDEEPLYLVKVCCPSTKAYYLLRVPPTMRTAQEAVAWTFGIDADVYDPEEES